MSEKQIFILIDDMRRQRAIDAIRKAEAGQVVEIKAKTRSLEQNARMWASLTDVSRQVDWYGKKLTPEEWKDVFSASLKKQDVVPGIDGGFVVLGRRTSQMTVREMSDLLSLMYAFGAERGVRFSDPAEAA